MGLGTLAAGSGMQQQPSRTEEALRGIGMLERLDQRMEQDRQESIQLQALEAEQYDQIAEFSSHLLERDRGAVQSKAIELQRKVTDKIREYGSRKKFLEAGGMSLLANYKRELLSSPEQLRAKDNKINMERILALQEAGKGHLLSERDMKNMIAYHNGEGNQITYSGIRAEIELPEKYYDYGYEISPKQILNYSDNYMKIYGNFVKDYPELKALQGQELNEMLEQYTWKHYRAKGMDKTKLEQENAMKRFRAQQESARVKGTPEEKEKADLEVPYVTSMNLLLNNGDSRVPLTVDNVIDSNYIDKLREQDPDTNAIFGDKTNAYSEAAIPLLNNNEVFNGAGAAVGEMLGLNNTFVPASAYKILPADKKALNEKFFEGLNPDGTVNYTISGDYYNPNGEKLESDVSTYASATNTVQNTGKATVMNYFLGWQDENGKMITKVADSDGKPLEGDKQKDHKKVFSGKPSHMLYAALKSEDGAIFYKGINMKDIKADTDISLALGASNNVGKAVAENATYDQQVAKQGKESQLNAKYILQENAKASSKTGVFATPEFSFEARTFSNNGSDRTLALKAYYMTLAEFTKGNGSAKAINESGFVKKKLFTTQVEQHEELQQAALDNKNYNDEQFIEHYGKVIAGDNAEDYKKNKIFTDKWLSYYKTLKNQ